jgi:large subunit ribosomal protein L21
MFAVIKTGGKQYRVAAEDVIKVEKLAGEPGETVEFAEVLMLGGDNVQVGVPTVAGAAVAGEVVQQSRGSKVIAFKKRRRKNSRRKRGHRQEFTMVRITEILTDGQRPTPRPKAEARPAPAVEAGAIDAGEADEAAETKRPARKAAAKPKTAKKPASTAKKPAARAKKPAGRAKKPAAGAGATKGKKK